jgi:AcrR family transcriptional regulator
MSGRRAQAALNDELILKAAREVFVEDPEAPIAEVARRAGVGMSALYRRYGSKEGLLRAVCRDGLTVYLEEVEAALADDMDPWDAFTRFMSRLVAADVASNTLRLAGTFTPTEDLYRDANRAQELNVRLVERLHAAGAIRPDVNVNDLSLIMEQLAAVRLGGEERTHELRQRYLALVLEALRSGSGAALPGPPPTWEEIQERWDPASGRGTDGAFAGGASEEGEAPD